MKVLCYNSLNVNGADVKKFDVYDVVVFGFEGLNKIRYKNELNGSESVLQNFASLSKTSKKILISGAITDNYGVLRRSAVIADKGKLLGISDMRLSVNDNGYLGGGAQRVYQTQVGRIGLLVGDDILDIDGIKAMSLCDADFIVAITSGEEKPQYNFLIRSYSYLFGVAIVLINSTGVIASDLSGEICGKSLENHTKITLPVKKSYRLVVTKQRGT